MFKIGKKSLYGGAIVAAVALACLSAAPAALADEVPTTTTTTAAPAPATTPAAATTPAPKPEAAPAAPSTPSPAPAPAPKPEPVAAPVAPAPAPAPQAAAPAAPAPAAPAPAPKPVVTPPAAPTPVPVATPGTTQQLHTTPAPTSSTTQSLDNNKPGKLQPVWCHLTGDGWKAQLGAKPSGGRNDTFPLMGDFGDGVTSSGQTLAHDRSDKLDSECCQQQVNNPQPPVYTPDVQTIPATPPQPNCSTLSVSFIPEYTITTTYKAVWTDGAWVKTVDKVTTSQHDLVTQDMTSDQIATYCPPAHHTDTATVTESLQQDCTTDSANLFQLQNTSESDGITFTATQAGGASAQLDLVAAGASTPELDNAWVQANHFKFGVPIVFTATASSPGATVTIDGQSSVSWTPESVSSCPANSFNQFKFSLTQPTCTKGSSVSLYILTPSGVTETVPGPQADLLDANGHVVTSVPTTPGTYTFSARLQNDGLFANGDVLDQVSPPVTFTLVGKDVSLCPPAVVPPVTPPTTPTPTPTPTPTQSTPPAPAQVSSTSEQPVTNTGEGPTANTGLVKAPQSAFDQALTVGIALTAMAGLLAAIATVVIYRRRHAAEGNTK